MEKEPSNMASVTNSSEKDIISNSSPVFTRTQKERYGSSAWIMVLTYLIKNTET